MSREGNEFWRALLGVRFLGPAVLGSALMILAALFGATAFQLAALGCLVSVASGFALVYLSRPRDRAAEVKQPIVPPALATHPQLSRLYQVVSETLIAVAGRPDGNLKEAIVQKLVALGVQFRAVASGTVASGGAESWYVAHDAVLTIPDLREYRAVVWVRTAGCASDPAVQESLRATFAAAHRGVLVERILVLPESLWPDGRLLPTDDIFPWIEEQHNHGLRVILLRGRDLATESELSVDTCVFDDWAVGTRDLDDRSRTVRVALDFTPATVRAALDRMERLFHLGISVRNLLDRAEAGG
jgi:hypothetical protein